MSVSLCTVFVLNAVALFVFPPLGQALGAALSRGGRRAPSEDLLFRWFREWIQGGVFQAVRLV